MAGRTVVNLKHGDKARVVKIRGKGHFHRRLLRMGLVLGCTVEVERAVLAGASIEVSVNGRSLSLLTEEAAKISVETT